MINGKMDRGNKNLNTQPSICCDDWEKPRKTLRHNAMYRDLNSRPPEYEFSVLPLCHVGR